MENDNTVLLNPPLFALDKDAPLRYAGRWATALGRVGGRERLVKGQRQGDVPPRAGFQLSPGNDHLRTLFWRRSPVKSGGNLGTA